MPKCTVCHHPERQAIDLALLNETSTYEALSKIYGPSLSSLFRHKKHLVEKMRRARRRLKDSQEQGCLFKLNVFLDHVQRAVRTAEVDGHVDRILKGSHVGSRIIRQINQMEVPLELDTVYRLISSPQWVSQDSLLPTDPRIITGSHQALADQAFSLCPDPEPEIIPAATHSSRRGTQNLALETPKPGPEPDPDLDDADDGDEEDAATADLAQTVLLETCNSAPETPLPPGITSELLQQILRRLDQPPLIQPKTENRKLETENRPKNQREISAKLARKTPRMKQNNHEYQQDKVCKKNTRKNSCVGRESEAPPADLMESQAPPADLMESQAPPAALMESAAPPAARPSCSLPVNFNPELPPETGNQQPETVLTEHESLFDRLRRKWAQTAPASKYSCDSEKLYAEYLQEKAAAGVLDPLPEESCPDPAPATATQPPETENPQLRTQNSELRTCHETPQPDAAQDWEPLNPFTHPKEYYFALEHGYRIENTPKHIPDRRWEEDFGNPRKFKGTY